jgi:hypothetical protein
VLAWIVDEGVEDEESILHGSVLQEALDVTVVFGLYRCSVAYHFALSDLVPIRVHRIVLYLIVAIKLVLLFADQKYINLVVAM